MARKSYITSVIGYDPFEWHENKSSPIEMSATEYDMNAIDRRSFPIQIDIPSKPSIDQTKHYPQRNISKTSKQEPFNVSHLLIQLAISSAILFCYAALYFYAAWSPSSHVSNISVGIYNGDSSMPPSNSILGASLGSWIIKV